MIRYTLEILAHFRCMECSKWWSIADWPIEFDQHAEIICPHCGNKSVAEAVDRKMGD